MHTMMPWIVLISYLLILLLFDFFVLHKKNRVITTKRAFETFFFISNALIFSGLIYWFYDNGLVTNLNNLQPNQAVIKYLTGYLIELSLSVDNLFVIAIIFTFEIVDEKDKVEDMQQYALKRWQEKQKKYELLKNDE